MPLGSSSNARKRRRIAGIPQPANLKSARVEREQRKLLVRSPQRRTDSVEESYVRSLEMLERACCAGLHRNDAVDRRGIGYQR